MKIFFDTEFTGLHKNTTLISIGLIDENGRTFYAEFNDYNRSQVGDWIQENVIDNLKFNHYTTYLGPVDNESCNQHLVMKGSKQEVVGILKEWLEKYDQVQLVSDVCHYDMVLFIDLFGSAMDLPKNICPVCHDICQDITQNWLMLEDWQAFNEDRERILQGFGIKIPGNKHNALYDAVVIKNIWEIIHNIHKQ